MPSSALPSVLAGLVAVGNTIPDVTASYGPAVSGETGDYLMVGVDDPDSTNPAQAAAERQQWAFANSTTRDCDGTVTCAITSDTGDGTPAGLQAAAERAFAILGTFELTIRADYTLAGLASLMWAELADLNLSWNQTEFGAFALLVFTVHYRARI